MYIHFSRHSSKSPYHVRRFPLKIQDHHLVQPILWSQLVRYESINQFLETWSKCDLFNCIYIGQQSHQIYFKSIHRQTHTLYSQNLFLSVACRRLQRQRNQASSIYPIVCWCAHIREWFLWKAFYHAVDAVLWPQPDIFCCGTPLSNPWSRFSRRAERYVNYFLLMRCPGSLCFHWAEGWGSYFPQILRQGRMLNRFIWIAIGRSYPRGRVFSAWPLSAPRSYPRFVGSACDRGCRSCRACGSSLWTARSCARSPVGSRSPPWIYHFDSRSWPASRLCLQ